MMSSIYLFHFCIAMHQLTNDHNFYFTLYSKLISQKYFFKKNKLKLKPILIKNKKNAQNYHHKYNKNLNPHKK